MNKALIIAPLLLFIFGTVSLSGIRQDLLMRHLIFFVTGGIVCYFIRQFSPSFFRRNALLFFVLSFGLVVITYVLGVEVKGSTRWIDVFFFRFQPSELLKVSFILYLAELCAAYKPHQSQGILLVKMITTMAFPVMIVALQPDLGSALVFIAISGVMLVQSPISGKRIMTLLVILCICSPLLWFALHSYQKDRIRTFVYSLRHESKASYNMTQSMITVGSGHVWGKGLGLGKQARLSFLPEFHTDFAFASLVEQFGFVGGGLVIVLYSVFFALCFYEMARQKALNKARDMYSWYYLLGVTAFFASQSIINIGMNIGILPIAGITLPFISYGGSSLIVSMMAVALIPERAHN